MKKDRRTDDGEGRFGGVFEGNGVNREGMMCDVEIVGATLRLIAFYLMRSRTVPISIRYSVLYSSVMTEYTVILRAGFCSSITPFLLCKLQYYSCLLIVLRS